MIDTGINLFTIRPAAGSGVIVPMAGLVARYDGTFKVAKNTLSDPRVSDISPGAKNPGVIHSGTALQFDGIADQVTLEGSAGNFQTIAFSINPLTLTEEIIDLNGVETITLASGTITLNGTWAGSIIYVDGVVGSALTLAWHRVAITTTAAIAATAFKLANIASAFGTIDLSDVLLWSPILTPAEILFDYENPEQLASNEPGSTLDPSTDLILHCPITDNFSHASYTSILDSSGNGFHGVNVSAGAAWINQQAEIVAQNALRSVSYKNMGSGAVGNYFILDLTTVGSFTLSAWVFIDQVYDYGEVVGAETFFTFNTSSDGTLFYLIGNPGIWLGTITSLAGVLENNSLYHMVGTYNSINDLMELYLNDSFIGSITASAAKINETQSTGIMRRVGPSAYPLRGFTDEVAWFDNVAFNAAQVSEMYNGGIPLDALTHSESANLSEYVRNVGKSTWPNLANAGNPAIQVGNSSLITNPEGLISGKDGLGFPITDPRTFDFLNSDGTAYVLAGQDISIQPANAITMAAWIKPFALPSADVGILTTPSKSEQSGMQLIMNSGGKVEFKVAVALNSLRTIVFDDAIPFDPWVFVAGTWDALDDLIKGYVNNILQVDTNTAATSFFGTVDVDSKTGQISTDEFPGIIGDRFIYNKRLTDMELTDLFNATKGKHGL